MLPIAFEERMKEMLGEEYPAFLESYDKEKYQALRVNTLKVNKEAFLERSAFDLTQVPWEQNGFYYTAASIPIMRQVFIIYRSPVPWHRFPF